MKNESNIIKKAVSYISLYNNDTNFQTALELVPSKEGKSAKEILDSQIKEFLFAHGINPDTSPENLEKLVAEDIQLVGEAYHFTRKGVLTSYDAILPGKEEPANPLLIIQNTFDALKQLDNKTATGILSRICDLTSKDNQEQIKVIAGLDILCSLGSDFNKETHNLDKRHPVKGKRYERESDELVRNYIDGLKSLLDYIKDSRLDNNLPSIEGFSRYCEGLKKVEPKNKNEDSTNKNVDFKYISRLLDEFGNDYRQVISRFEVEVGNLLIVDFNGSPDKGEFKILTGNPYSPNNHKLNYTKRDIDCHVKELFLFMCRHIQGSEIPPIEFKVKTSNTARNIENYL